MIDLSKKLSQSLQGLSSDKSVMIVCNNIIPLIVGLFNPIAGIIATAVVMCY